MKIIIVLPDLGGGGAERLHVYLANDWINRGFCVEFVVMRKGGELITLLDSSIKVTVLNVKRIGALIIPLSLHLYKSRPQIVLAAMWPLTSATIFAWLLSGRSGKLFLSDHENLTLSYLDQRRTKANFLRKLIQFTYPFASGVIAVSSGVKQDLCLLGKLTSDKVRVIYNPAAIGVSPVRETDTVRKQLWEGIFTHHILSVGRLAVQKDQATLIKAFSMLPKEIDAKLIILGDGPLKGDLLELVSKLGIERNVSFPGFVADPYPWFRSADLFVLPSRWEGFGNVLVESLECGLPVVSTDCPSGPAEILENGRYGKLVAVQDPIAMAAAIVQSLNIKHDREALMLRAQDFSVRKISDEYLEYISTKN